MALPSAVSYCTVTFAVRLPVRVTVNTTGSPSLADALAMDRAGELPPPAVSLSLMVTVAVPFAMFAPPVGLLSLTVKFSACSWSPSSVVGTEIVRVVTPGVNVSVSDVVV